MMKQPSPNLDWNSTANDQMAMLAAANGAFVKAMAKASQGYVDGVGELTREFSDFLNIRLKHDVELGETLSNCKDWSQLADAQQEWFRQAGEEYLAEAQRIVDLSMKLATNGSSFMADPSAGGAVAKADK